MKPSFNIITAVFLVSIGSLGQAGPLEDIAAATQVWIDAMNTKDPDRVVALYDPTAVLWGTRSVSIRDTPTTIRDYFNSLKTAPTSYKVTLVDQRIRLFDDVAINSGSYTFSEIRDEKPILRPARFTFVFANRNGRWLIVDHHSSAVPAQ